MERDAVGLLPSLISSRSRFQKGNFHATFLQQDRVQGLFHLCSDKVSFSFLFSNLVESGGKKSKLVHLLLSPTKEKLFS